MRRCYRKWIACCIKPKIKAATKFAANESSVKPELPLKSLLCFSMFH
jgi:hypothetical protein